jgi:hypothetical protein
VLQVLLALEAVTYVLLAVAGRVAPMELLRIPKSLVVVKTISLAERRRMAAVASEVSR